jgi:hypothetical protein
MSAHPPRPRLVLRVGITGHRWDKLDRAAEPLLLKQITAVLREVRDLAAKIGNDDGSGYRSPEADPSRAEPATVELRLITALAEGADRLLVEAAPTGWQLQAILPFPPDVYQEDFTEPNSRQTLDDLLARAHREAGVVILDGDRQAEVAFGPVGAAVCLNSDVLIAIWNGLAGKPGGTGEVVNLGIRLGVPVVHIMPDGTQSPWLHRPDLKDRGTKDGLQDLDHRLRRLYMPPVPPDDADADERKRFRRLDLRERYFAETRRPWQRGQFYAFVIRLLGFRWKRRAEWWKDARRAGLPCLRPSPAHYGEAIRERWTRKWQRDLGLSGPWIDRIFDSRLPDHYGWASYLANYYAGRYRNAFFAGYMLAWLAVGLAAAGMAAELVLLELPDAALPDLVPLLAILEAAVLLVIFTVVGNARRRKFHERWLAYRSLTEGFRSLTYTLPLARTSTLSARGARSVESWTDWMHRAVVREVGVLPLVMTPAHLEETRRLLLDDVLQEQMRYHEKNAGTLSKVDHLLHTLATMLFLVAMGLSLSHLLQAVQKSVSHDDIRRALRAVALSVVGITIPAFASSLHGLLSQGEFESTAERSRRTRRELEAIADRVKSVPATSDALGELATETAQAMDAELGAWFVAYQAKRVTYP